MAKKDETTWGNMHPEAREQVSRAIRRAIKEKTMKRGTITNARGQGGLLSLTIQGSNGSQTVYGDNGPTVRALMSLFGSEIVSGHTLLVDRIVGQEVCYEVDDLGLLVSLAEP